MINETHIGLVRMNEGQLIGVQYLLSKWERNLGDVLTINGTKWNVGIIGDTRNDVIGALNDIIKKQNSIINKQNYQIIKKERIETNRIWNKILTEVMEDLNKCGF
jgi:hypothetical protein